MVEVSVKGITLDPITNMPVVVLKSKNSNDILPLWIGVFEANAIATILENIQRPRPMTHDLMKNIFDTLNAQVKHVYISDIVGDTYYAKIIVNSNGSEHMIDARPSDAINLALRCNVPIYVSEEILEKIKKELEMELEEDELEEWLESIKPEDFS
jgi:bifunctional DNase/RNase